MVRVKELEKVSIPDSLEYLGHNAFKNSPWLNNNLEYVDGCYYLGKILYKSDKDIVRAVIREGTVMVGEWAFKGCSKLEQVQVPDSVKHIGTQAFCGCKNLENISDLFAVSIGESAFTNCNKLKRLIVKNLDVNVANNIFASPTRADFHVPNDIFIPNVKIDSMKPIQKLFFQLCFLQGMKYYSDEEKSYYLTFVNKSKRNCWNILLRKTL